MKKYNVDFLVSSEDETIPVPYCVSVEAEDAKAAKAAAERDLKTSLKADGFKISETTIQYIGTKEVA